MVLVLVTLFAVGCSRNPAPTATKSPSPSPTNLAWTDCGSGFQCATVQVPLDDPQEKQAAIDADKNFAAGCKQRSAQVLGFVDTASAARDMDMIRAALGDAKLTYLGFSYGTYLGQHYAHLFPTHIRALALDSVVDPALEPNDFLYAQLVAFEGNLQAFLTDCRARRSA